jgi:hypothetical protein
MTQTGLIWHRKVVSDKVFLGATSIYVKCGVVFVAEEVLPCQKGL